MRARAARCRTEIRCFSRRSRRYCPSVCISGPSEVVAQLSGIRPWRNEMRSAERRQKVVKGDFVRHIDDREGQTDSLVTTGVENVVVSDREIEKAARTDARRVVIIILRPWRGNADARRPV